MKLRLLLILCVILASSLPTSVTAQQPPPPSPIHPEPAPRDGLNGELDQYAKPASDDLEQAFAESAAATANATENTRPSVRYSRPGAEGRQWSTIEVAITWALLVFTLIVLGMVVYLAKSAAKAWSPQSVLRVFGITLIIPMAVLLITAGYSEKQIGAVIGLLGVIAGYLLGNGDKSRDAG